MVKKLKSKDCPKCKKQCGQKVRTCPNKKCGHKFTFNKVIKNAKKCPNCTHQLRPRAKECDKCQYVYPVKKKGYEEIPLGEWRKLKRGEQIYLRKGCRGPYYEGEKGRIAMGYRGQFNVKFLEKNGIIAYSPINGFAFIYMGKTETCESTGVIKRKYRLWRKVG